jgi:uncharacterized protein involved in outer membrane biogenesis
MGRTLIIFGILVGVAFLVLAALIGYAFVNLNSIVNSNQRQILAQVSDVLGRPVQVERVQVHAGWGVSVEVTGVKVADDPAFSQLPFFAASEVSVEFALLPLLHRDIRVSKLHLIKPDIRIVRNTGGKLNVSTVGGPAVASGSPLSAATDRIQRVFAQLSIKALRAADGAIHYTDLAEPATPIEIRHLTFRVTRFSAASPFDIDLKFAFLADRQNVEVSGKVGRPLDLKIRLDSIVLDGIRRLALVGLKISAALSIQDAVSVCGTIHGSLSNLAFAVSTDLTKDRIAYAGTFDKPAGTPMTLTANRTRTAEKLEIARAELKLADLDLTASGVSLGAQMPASARVDTNSFSLAGLSSMVPFMAGRPISGKSEIHGIVTLDSGRLIIKPTRLTLGSAHASLEARVESLRPLSASYTLKADSVRLSELFPSRPPDELVKQLVIVGTANGEASSAYIRAKIRSTDGSVANISYRNLDVNAAYDGEHASARPLNVEVFGGYVSLNAEAIFDTTPRFNLALSTRSVNVEQALRSQDVETADTLHGYLTGSVIASGSGTSWNAIKPTLRGNGRLALANGKLLGVNIVSRAINAVAAAPGVSQLVNAAFISSHHGLLVDLDTELPAINMTFQLEGTRFTTHNLTVQVAKLRNRRPRMVRHGQEHRHQRRHCSCLLAPGRNTVFRGRKTAGGCGITQPSNIGSARGSGRDYRHYQYTRSDHRGWHERGRQLDGRRSSGALRPSSIPNSLKLEYLEGSFV